MTTTGPRPPGEGRLYFLDNLRSAMIALVVLYHAGAVYESSGLFASFWIVDDPATNDLVGIVNVLVDIVVMPALFFASGYFAPPSLARRPGWGFAVHRFRRLMVPWLLAAATLVPLYKVVFLASRGLPQEPWTTYFHMSNGDLGQSWLWFLPVLFVFDVALWALSRLRVRPPRLPMRTAVVGVFALATLYGFAVTYLGGTGWTKGPLLDFQNERLGIYFLLFLLGAHVNRLGVLEQAPRGKGLYIAVACTAWIPMNVYIVVLLSLIFRPGAYFVSLGGDLLLLWTAYALSMLALLYLLVGGFQRWGRGRGRVMRVLADNAYGVYVLHVPLLGGLALVLLPVGVPSLLKYVAVALGTYGLGNLLVSAYRRVRRPAVAA